MDTSEKLEIHSQVSKLVKLMKWFTTMTIIKTKFGHHHQLLLTPPHWESYWLFLSTREVHCIPSTWLVNQSLRWTLLEMIPVTWKYIRLKKMTFLKLPFLFFEAHISLLMGTMESSTVLDFIESGVFLCVHQKQLAELFISTSTNYFKD